MALVRITDLDLIPFSSITYNDVFPIVDIDADVTYKIDVSGLTKYISSQSNRWYIQSGETVTVYQYDQKFIYGDLLIEGELTIEEDAKLYVINGNIELISGGTISGLGNYYLIDIPEFDTYVTGGTHNIYSGVTTFINNANELFDVGGYPISNYKYIPSGVTISVPANTQKFIYGDIIIDGELFLDNNSELFILNGDIFITGGTITGTGDIYSVDLPKFDTKVSNLTYSNNILTIYDNSGNTFNAEINTMTGLTVNGVLSSTTISATTIDLCGSNGTLYTGTISGCSPIDILSETYFYEGLSATTISGDTFYGDGSNLTSINFTGGTVTGETIFSGGLSATTISGDTFYGDGSNLTGIGSKYSNVIFVDSENGNDLTGAVNDFNKPFSSISSACFAAYSLPGRNEFDRALIYIRRGGYLWNGYLIDYCDFYSEPGVLFFGGRISDQASPVPVNCNFLGYSTLYSTDIYVSKASTVKFQFSKLINNNAAFLFIPVGGTANIVVEADYIYSQTIGTSYLGTVRGSSNVTITVKDKIESPYSHWTFRNSYSGTFILNCPQSILLTGSTYTGSKQIVYATDVTSTAKIVINGDLISTDSTYYGGTSSLVSLWGFGSGYFELNGNITTNQNVSVYSNITNSAGRAKINGSVYSALRPVISINNGTTLIQNGTILTTTTDSTIAEAVYVAGTSTLYLMNCFIVAGTDFSITKIDSSTALFQIYNCIGYSPGTLGDCVTSSTPGYTVRMSNFKTNKPLSVNVTDVFSPTGLSVDANVIAPNF